MNDEEMYNALAAYSQEMFPDLSVSHVNKYVLLSNGELHVHVELQDGSVRRCVLLQNEFWSWVRDNMGVGGGSMTTYNPNTGRGFPRRHFNPVQAPDTSPAATQTAMPVPTAAMATPSAVAEATVTQNSWLGLRSEYAEANIERLRSDCTSKLSMETKQLDGTAAYVLKCACANGTKPICVHRAFAYQFAMDRIFTFDCGINSAAPQFNLGVPIGLGLVYANVTMTWETIGNDDRTSWIIADNRVTTGIAEQLSAFPQETSTLRVPPTDGALTISRYIESMLVSTLVHFDLSDATKNQSELVSLVGHFCRRKHSPSITAHHVANLTRSVPSFESYLMANAYTLASRRLCLPCYNISSPELGVPQF